MRQSMQDKLNEVGRHGGTFMTGEVKRAGISTRTLYRLRESGEVARVSRGVYQIADAPGTISPDYAAIAKRVPEGVICLLSALYHHDLTTEIPREIHLAVHRDANVPRLDYPRVRVFRMSSHPFNAGIEHIVIGGAKLRIFSPEKTIADCFKYRNRLGTAVAVEALKNYMSRRGRNPGRVLEMARVCRMDKVVRPYLEALV
ncbi:MAG: type IV toxin-antitoxin system AbiEi family antitoxin domain-containing protein [bacterium]